MWQFFFNLREFAKLFKLKLKAYLKWSAFEVGVQVGDHALLIGRHVQDEVEKSLPPHLGREVHLEIVLQLKLNKLNRFYIMKLLFTAIKLLNFLKKIPESHLSGRTGKGNGCPFCNF